MSITTDIRTYADTAVNQGKEIAGKASAAVVDLRAQAEKAINVDAIKTAVEPYLAQVKGYGHDLTERAESLFDTVRSDARVAKVLDTAGVVVEVVQEKVVKPVQSLSGRGSKPNTSKAASKPSAPKPASRPAATKPAATKPAAKPAARKAPAKRATKS